MRNGMTTTITPGTSYGTGENADTTRITSATRRLTSRAFCPPASPIREVSRHRRGRRRGEPSGALSPLAFVNFLQNHDQIGNRPLGDRLALHAERGRSGRRARRHAARPDAAALFMGEEWGSTRTFPFFCDFHGALADAVRKGRREEFKAAYEALGDEIPRSSGGSNLRSAVLDWDAPRHRRAARGLRSSATSC